MQHKKTPGINRRMGSALQWSIVAIGIMITACGVYFWVQNLPAAPRYSPLTLEPGAASVRAPRATVEIAVAGQTVIRPVSKIEFDLDRGEAFATDLPTGRFKALYRIAIDVPDVTFASLGANLRDCRVRFLRDDDEIRSTTATDGSEVETGAMVFPAGRSEFQIEVETLGAAPAFKAWWRLESSGPKSSLPAFDVVPNPADSRPPASRTPVEEQ